MAALIPGFVADLPNIVCRVLAVLEQNNLRTLEAEMQQLKEAAGEYGFLPVSQAVERIRGVMASAQPFEIVAGETHKLIELIQSVEGYGKEDKAPEADRAAA